LRTDIISSFETEVEALSVDPKYQRQGIGALLLSHFISSEVEKNPAAVYISSTPEGKGLYERFGWTVLGKHVADLSHAGIEKPIDLFDMLRK
jgi:ribosomal protein S18 acetylase RimI-like enzyme